MTTICHFDLDTIEEDAKRDLKSGLSCIQDRAATILSLVAEVDSLHAELRKISAALGAYPDSDLVSLATTTAKMASQLERVSEERDAARAECKVWYSHLWTLRP
jgi:hypothetical protein